MGRVAAKKSAKGFLPVGQITSKPVGAALSRAVLLFVAAFGAAACSTSNNVDVMLFADPGKYEYHTCEQILNAGRATADREKKLRELIQKAEQSAGGALVGTVAYRGEYRTVVEELGVIDTVSRRKNCLTPPSWRSTTAIQ